MVNMFALISNRGWQDGLSEDGHRSGSNNADGGVRQIAEFTEAIRNATRRLNKEMQGAKATKNYNMEMQRGNSTRKFNEETQRCPRRRT